MTLHVKVGTLLNVGSVPLGVRRTAPFETAHPAYSFLNHLIAVGIGDRRPEGPIYTIHEVL